MTYPFAERTRVVTPEVLMYSKTVSNTKTASGVQTSTVNLPPGTYTVGVNVYTTAAGAAATGVIKVYAYQTPAQGDTAVLLSAALFMLPHATTTAVTLLTAPASTTSAGSSGHMVTAISAGVDAVVSYPYGLMIATTCSTSTGTVSYQLTATRRT